MRRLGLTFKKALGAAEQERPDMAKRRQAWRAAQPYIDPEHLVFLDETGVNTKMTRLYGWSPIRRFSEDIDLSFDRADLGYTGDRDPEKDGLSKKKSG